MFGIKPENYSQLNPVSTYEINPKDCTLNGKLCRIYSEKVSDPTPLFFIKKLGAVILTICTLSIAYFVSETIKNLWNASLKGRITHYVDTASIQKTSQVATSTLQPNQPNPVAPEAETRLEKQKAEFQRTAIQALTPPPHPIKEDIELHLTLSDQQKADLALAVSERRRYRPVKKDSPYSYNEGGTHHLFSLHSLPGVVFKCDSTGGGQTVEKELQTYQKAHTVVKQHQLNLIDIPRCSEVSVQVEGEEVALLAQEKVDVVGNFYYQKAFFRFALLGQKGLRQFMTEALRQLAKFIIFTGFSNVKYDNTPITKDGRICLYDLDEGNALKGLFEGGVNGRTNGLFSYSPDLETLDQLVAEVRAVLSEDPEKLSAFEARWSEESGQIKKTIAARVDRRERLRKFHADSNITTATQEINPKNVIYSKDKTIALIQDKLIAYLNQKIQQSRTLTSPHFDLSHGRSHIVNLNELYDENRTAFMPHFASAAVFFPKAIEALQELLEPTLGPKEKRPAGYNPPIGRYDYNRPYQQVIVKC